MKEFYLPMIGEKVDSYLLHKEIGRGGMAIIFNATDERTGKIVALKIMSSRENNNDFQERFQREFKALSNLNHPNVLQVFERGEINGQPYFTMEYLEGETLKDHVKSWTKISSTERFAKARNILIQMAKALDYIHHLGWVHRDISPSNIMILPDNSVKLMDFGVVKIPGTELTMAGEVIGTVAYIPPEQILNKDVDPRADLYSLGACLYLMLTGERPFRSRTISGFLTKHLKEKPIPPSSFSPMIPEDLEQTCLRLLEKDPVNRFASANHLLQYLNNENSKPCRRNLIGRTRELHQIREKLAGLTSQKGGVILLESEHGLGKSQLLHATGNILDNLEIFWSLGKNYGSEQPTYSGFQTLLEEIKTSSNQSSINSNSSQNDQWTLFSQVQENLQSYLPMAILMDNLELADKGTIALLEFLIFSTIEDELPIFFLLSYNTNAGNPIPEIDLLLKLESVRRIVLKPLTQEAVEEWLLCQAKNDEMIPLLAKRLHQEGEGSPFFIEEMLRSLQVQGIINKDQRALLNIQASEIDSISLPLPESIQTAAIERIKNLPLVQRFIIEILTVDQQELSDKLLLEVLKSLQPPVSIHPFDFQHIIEELHQKDILQYRDVEGQKLIELAHIWLRDIILANIPKEQTKQLHYALGRTHEAYHQNNIGSVVEKLAYHFEQAEKSGKGYAYLLQASQNLRSRSMFHEALSYLDRALKIEPYAREHLTLENAEGQLAELLLNYSFIAQRLGEGHLAQKQANLADQIAGDQKNIVLLAKIATEKACQARERYNLGEADLQIRRALSYAEQSGQLQLQILPLYEQGALYWEESQMDKAKESFEKALDLSEQFNDQLGIARVNIGLGVLSMCVGNTPTARHAFERSIQSSSKMQRIEELVIAQTNLAELHHCAGNFKRGLDLSNSAIQKCRQIRYRAGLGMALRYSAILLTDIARFAEAEEHAKLAISVNSELENEQETLASLVVLIRIYLASKDWGHVSSLLPKAISLAKDYDAEGYLPILLSWKARLIVHIDNDISQATRLLYQAVSQLKRHWKHQEVRCFLNLARAWIACERPEDARNFAQKALFIAGSSGYRYYAMRARQILATITLDPVERARHERVAKALKRSLAASLDTKNGQFFSERHRL